MRPVRSVLTGVSPLMLAREALWRTTRRWKRLRFLAALRRICPVRYCPVGYYHPSVEQYPVAARRTLLCYAELVCEGKFSFLGYGPLPLGFPPPWNLDFVSGKGWPQQPSSSLAVVRHDGSDVKVPWELSRLQFLPVLGKAWKLSGDRRYRQAAKELLSNWIREQPVGFGVNWTIAMEAALRSISICLLLELLWPFRTEEMDWLQEVTLSLWHHLLFIESHIEFSHIVRSNHYLSNLLGLFCLSMFLDGEGMTAKRHQYGSQIEQEILRQVYEDGGDCEASTGYQVFVAQVFAVALRLMQVAGIIPKPSLLARLRRMYQMMEELADVEGRIPHIGDVDDGRVELLLDDVEQLLCASRRHSLTISNFLGLVAALLGEASDRRSEDTAWYGLRPIRRLQRHRSGPNSNCPGAVVFPQSGIAIARQRETEVLFLAIPNGLKGKGSHTHNDKLSLILRIDREELLCDSGTAFYTREAATRNRFRATAAHNTVLVDGQEQNRIDSGKQTLFCLGNEAEVTSIESREEDGCLLLEASHHGYRRIGVLHTRTLLLEPSGFVRINDLFTGIGRHRFQAHYHLGPIWKCESLEEKERQIWCRVQGIRSVEFRLSAPVTLRAWEEPTEISTAYGTTRLTRRICVAADASLPFSLQTRIWWEN